MARSTLQLDWHGPRVLRATTDGVVDGLTIASEHLLGESRRVVPIEEGTLERSGRAQVDEADLTASVSYDTPYATRQHEELTWRHDPGRQARYLEEPMTTEAETMHALIATSVRRALR